MTVEVFFSPSAVDEIVMEGRTAVVIDVIRATSCIAEALANGARGIFPTALPEEAVKLASSLGREDTLLCGERKGLKIEGFDLGNSPGEYTAAVVEGKQLVMSTTNGTRALLAAEHAETVLVAALLNLSAVVEELKGVENLAVVCAGREDRFSLPDALCAGLLIRRVLGATGGDGVEMNDAGRIVLDVAEKYKPDVAFLKSTKGGQALGEIGMDGDLAFCASVDRHAIVPVMRERRIGLKEGT